MAEPTDGGTTAVVDPSTGRVVQTDNANLEAVLKGGFRLADDASIQAERDRRQYGEGLGNEAAAFGESALSGATVGLSDLAAKYIAPDYAEGLAKRRQYNETAAALGEGAGILGSALLTGGLSAEAGLAARGAQAFTAPARGLLALGEGATGLAGRALGLEAAEAAGLAGAAAVERGVLGTAAREAGAHAAGGALEGALFGTAKTVTDDLLNDRELSAERIKMGAGEGALWGAGLGGATGLVGSLLGSGGRKLSSMWERSDADHAATEAAERLEATAGTVADTTAEVAGQNLDTEQRLLLEQGFDSEQKIHADFQLSTSDAERRTAWDRLKGMGDESAAAADFEAQQQAAVGTIADAGNEIEAVRDKVSKHLDRRNKRQTVKDQLTVEAPEWTPDKAEGVLSSVNEIRDEARALLADHRQFLPQEIGALNDVVKAADIAERSLTGGKSGAAENAALRKELEAERRRLVMQEADLAQPPLAGDANAAARQAAQLNSVRGRLAAIEKEMGGQPGAVGRGTVESIADSYMDLDDLKGAVYRAAGKAGRAGPQTTAGGLLWNAGMRLRSTLESEGMWGKPLATMQRMTNAAESEAIRTGRVFEKRFAQTRDIRNVRGGEFGESTLKTLDRESVGGFLKKLGRAENQDAERDFVIGLQRQIDVMKTKSEFYRLPPELRAEVARAEGLAKSMVQDVRRLRTTKEAADRFSSALEGYRNLPVLGETLLKAHITGTKAVKMISNLAAEQSVSASGGKAIARSAAGSAVRAGIRGEEAAGKAGRGIVTWLRNAGESVGKAASQTGKAIARTAKGGPLLGVSMSVNEPASVERLIRNIGAMRDPQSDERRAMRVGAIPLRREHPELAQALEAHTQRVADFLADKAGDLSATARPGDPFGQLRGPRHSPVKAAKLARYVAAATNPAGALERIGTGQIVREDVEALQALYPKMYQRMVQDVLMNLSTVDELPSYDARVKLSHILNAPADPSMRPERTAALQQLAQTGAQPEAQDQAEAVGQPVLSPSRQRPPNKLGQMYATQVDRQATRGAFAS